MNVGTVHRRMAAGAPASALAKARRVIELTDHDGALLGLNLRVAFQAQIVIALDEHLGMDRAVRLMTGDAAFTHGFVAKNERTRLFPVALGALFIRAGHGKPARRFHDVHSVGIMADRTIHPPFWQRMMFGQIELGMHFMMAAVAGTYIFAGIDDEDPAPPTRRHMLASCTVTGFAAGHIAHPGALKVQPAVRAGRKNARDILVTIQAGTIAHEGSSRNRGRRSLRGTHRGTRGEDGANQGQRAQAEVSHGLSGEPNVACVHGNPVNRANRTMRA